MFVWIIVLNIYISVSNSCGRKSGLEDIYCYHFHQLFFHGTPNNIYIYSNYKMCTCCENTALRQSLEPPLMVIQVMHIIMQTIQPKAVQCTSYINTFPTRWLSQPLLIGYSQTSIDYQHSISEMFHIKNQTSHTSLN